MGLAKKTTVDTSCRSASDFSPDIRWSAVCSPSYGPRALLPTRVFRLYTVISASLS